jgi:hypothetical protein
MTPVLFRKPIRHTFVLLLGLLGLSTLLTLWRQKFLQAVGDFEVFQGAGTNLVAPKTAFVAPLLCFGLEFEHRNFTTRLLGGIDAPVEHVVVVLSGDDPSLNALEERIRKEYPFCKIIRDKRRLGNVGIWNTCLRYMQDVANASWALLLNNDIMLPPGSLANVSAAVMEVIRDPEFCLGTLRIRNIKGFVWSTLAVTRRTLDVLGFFDENVFPAYYEDNEYDIRIQKTHQSGTPCRLLPVHAANSFHHGPEDSEDYISGTVIYYNDGGDRSKKVIQDRANAWNPHYLAQKWNCPLYRWNECRYTRPFNRNDLSPRDWFFDPDYRYCIETGDSKGNFGCRYNEHVLPPEKVESHPTNSS